jgi:hypothetical protein
MICYPAHHLLYHLREGPPAAPSGPTTEDMMQGQDRYKITLVASYRTQNGSMRTAELIEIWRQGCRLIHATGLPKRTEVSLSIARMGPFAAQVVEISKDVSEFRFVQPLYPPILTHLVEQAGLQAPPPSPAPPPNGQITGWRPRRPVA